MNKLPFDALEEMLTDAESKVPIDSRWCHYKGGQYLVRMHVVREEDSRIAVVYSPLSNPAIHFDRLLDVWLETIDDGKPVPRFERID